MRTMRKERRGLERARRVERSRFVELRGNEEETVVRTEAASSWVRTGSEGGESTDAAAAAWASLRAFCRRRWGRSSGMVAVKGDISSFAGRGGTEAVNDVEVDDCPLETVIDRGRKALLRK